MITVYGIPNCDKVKAARAWLTSQKLAYAFHDYKTAGVDRAFVSGLVATHGWEAVVNRRGTTFRALAEAERADLDADRAVRLMLAQPSLIRRPILRLDDASTLLGFEPAAWARALGCP